MAAIIIFCMVLVLRGELVHVDKILLGLIIKSLLPEAVINISRSY